MVKIEGKNGISATIIADSINSMGDRMITMEWQYPRIIHAEVVTHSLLKRNSQSSRAIPLTKAIELVRDNPFQPVWWGKKQAGMSASEELSGDELARAQHLWNSSRESAIVYAEQLELANLHKQIASRILEPWMMHKIVISGTEGENFIWLRDHSAAQPEIRELAQCVKTAIDASTPFLLHPGEWHLPYVETDVITDTDTGEQELLYMNGDGEIIDLDTARKISASCCAQVSYRKLDDSVEKALDIFNKLLSGERVHASPTEHQATPMLEFQGMPEEWEEGITHVDRAGVHWSANLRGWIQFRKLIPNEAVW